jgi:glycosyltransferase involved in cell wall biosynthesis
MNKNLEYSILMSVYYKEKADWLKESINSMLNQSVKPAEFVIIKDGKLTDELDDVISQFHDNNQELFSIYELSENVGLGRALAYGVNKCKHNLIVRMDSDDISDYRRCEKLINKYCENTSLDIYSHGK